MQDFAKHAYKAVRLALLWIVRIFLAPNHFRVSPLRKIWMNLHGFTSDQCVLYCLDRERMKEYLSEFDWYRSRWINEPFDKMLNNKVVFSEAIRPYVKTPELYAVKNSNVIVAFDGSGEAKTSQDLVSLVLSNHDVFMKPIATGKGEGAYYLSFHDDVLRINGNEATADEMKELFDSSDGWFLSEKIDQHPYLDEIYDKTTNTIRLITLRDPKTGELKVFFAVQRIGTSSTIPVDNGSKGGLVSKIDLETGSLSEARSLHNLDCYTHHPDSGAPIQGVTIPGWERIKKTALDLAKKFPYLLFIAWDLLPIEDGVCLIEANSSSGPNIIQ